MDAQKCYHSVRIRSYDIAVLACDRQATRMRWHGKYLDEHVMRALTHYARQIAARWERMRAYRERLEAEQARRARLAQIRDGGADDTLLNDCGL